MQAQWKSNKLTEPFGDASEIYQHLEHLRSKEDLTAEIILADAEKLSSPLHERFDWSDRSAARRFRRIQASALMARLVKPDGKRIYMRVGSKKAGTQHYDLVSRVMKSPSLRRPIARRALSELSGWAIRYEDFPELKQAMVALRKALQSTIQPAIREMEQEGAAK